MKIREIMNAKFRPVRPDDMVLSAVTSMRDDYVHFVCVCDDEGRPQGVVNEYDVIEGVCSVDRRPSEVLVRDVMSRQIATCEVDDDLEKLVDVLFRAGQQRALIVDGMGRLVGLVTLTDILHYLAPLRAQQLALRYVERGFRVRGRGPAPAARGSEDVASSPPSLASAEALRRLLLEFARAEGDGQKKLPAQNDDSLQVGPKSTL